MSGTAVGAVGAADGMLMSGIQDDPEALGVSWTLNCTTTGCIVLWISSVAAPASGVAAKIIGKTMSAILELTPLDSCTTKSSIKGPVVLVTNLHSYYLHCPQRFQIQALNWLQQRLVGVIHIQYTYVTYIGTFAGPDVGQSHTNENKKLLICTDYWYCHWYFLWK